MAMNVADQASGENFHAWNGDCVTVTRGIPDASIDYTIFSPPFQSLYTFSDDPRDMSNCKTGQEFFEHFKFLITELYRVTKPGRLVSIHCMNLPTSKTRDGFIGISDFRGNIIRAFQGNETAELYSAMRHLRLRASMAKQDGDASRHAELTKMSQSIEDDLKAYPGMSGFHFHSEVMIRKDPVSAMQRSKAIGLLHKQVAKDSNLSRMAVPDTIITMFKPNDDFTDDPSCAHIITMRKPGDNEKPIAGPFDRYFGTESAESGPLKLESAFFGTRWVRPGDIDKGVDWFSVAVWQRYAEPVWMDIAQGDVLSRKEAREEKDEAHIAPLQLTPIRRCIDLWSNPGDTVFSPFAGIGSELYVALQMGRKALGVELKPSYFKQLVHNCKQAKVSQEDIFSIAEKVS